MKPIRLNEEQQEGLFKKFIEEFAKQMENFIDNLNDTKITIPINFSSVSKDKITILFTPLAYIRMMKLVKEYSTEVGWYGLVDRLDEHTFRVYDVKLCKQYVNGGKVDTEDEDTLEFFNSLTDEEAEAMHFQAHSHVNMGTTPSGTDTQNQIDVVRNMGNKGFYIFQIWNKSGDINSFIYDLDNNVFYDRKDIVVEIEDEKYGTISDFLESTEELVLEKTYPKTVYNQGYYGNYKGYNVGAEPQKKKDEKEKVGYGYYTDGGYPAHYYDEW